MSGLTDEERELKRLAEDAANNGGAAHGNLLDHLDGSTVLRLLARIEGLDRACGDAHKELFLGGGGVESIASAMKILEATEREP